MSNSLYLSKLTHRNNFDMSHYHLTTMDIGFPQIQLCQPVIPTDSINASCQAFMRLSPLVFPTYARMRHKFISAYVANYMVDEYFEYAQNGTTLVGSVYTHPLTLSWTDLMKSLARSAYSSVKTNTDYDFAVLSSSGGSTSYRKFTARGRRAYKILKDLGYDITSYPSSGISSKVDFLSAYPLLCYCQFVNDVILPQQYRNTSALNSLLEEIKHRRVSSYLTMSNLRSYVNSSGLDLILDTLTSAYAMYREDYFTTAWAKPNTVTTTSNNTQTTFPFTSENTDGDISKLNVTQGSVNTFVQQDEQGNEYAITARSLEALKMFDKWVRRNNFVGNSTLSRLYSRFGIKTEQARSHFTDVLRVSSAPVNISDVTSFSDTKSSGGSDLGSYVGKGYSSGNFKFNFKSPDFGYVFCVSYIECDPLYDRGLNRDVLVTTYEDFYQPEFDGLQASPVLSAECSLAKLEAPRTSVFGFQPHYEWMRSHRDGVSGDLLTNDNMKSWFTAKSRSLFLAQDENTLIYQLGTFNNIFQDAGNDLDHFICSFDFDMKMNRPIRSSSQATGLEQGDLKVAKFGNN